MVFFQRLLWPISLFAQRLSFAGQMLTSCVASSFAQRALCLTLIFPSDRRRENPLRGSEWEIPPFAYPKKESAASTCF
jgi:hypothetical protein